MHVCACVHLPVPVPLCVCVSVPVAHLALYIHATTQKCQGRGLAIRRASKSRRVPTLKYVWGLRLRPYRRSEMHCFACSVLHMPVVSPSGVHSRTLDQRRLTERGSGTYAITAAFRKHQSPTVLSIAHLTLLCDSTIVTHTALITHCRHDIDRSSGYTAMVPETLQWKDRNNTSCFCQSCTAA